MLRDQSELWIARKRILYHIGGRVNHHLVYQEVLMSLIGLVLKLGSLFSSYLWGVNDD